MCVLTIFAVIGHALRHFNMSCSCVMLIYHVRFICHVRDVLRDCRSEMFLLSVISICGVHVIDIYDAHTSRDMSCMFVHM